MASTAEQSVSPSSTKTIGTRCGARLDQPSPAGQLSLFAPAPSVRPPCARRDHPAELRRVRNPRRRPCRSRGGRGARLQPLQSGLLHEEACDSTRRRSTLEPREAPVRCREVDSEIAKGLEQAVGACVDREGVPCVISTSQRAHGLRPRRVDNGVRHGQNARRPPRRRGENARARFSSYPRSRYLPRRCASEPRTPSAPSLPRGLLG
jgi:hypothetical protein